MRPATEPENRGGFNERRSTISAILFDGRGAGACCRQRRSWPDLRLAGRPAHVRRRQRPEVLWPLPLPEQRRPDRMAAAARYSRAPARNRSQPRRVERQPKLVALSHDDTDRQTGRQQTAIARSGDAVSRLRGADTQSSREPGPACPSPRELPRRCDGSIRTGTGCSGR